MIAVAALLWMNAAQVGAPPQDDFLRLYAQTRRFRSGHPVSTKVSKDGAVAFFLRSGATSSVQALFMTDLKTGETREVLNAERLLAGASETLSVAERARLERQRITARGFTDFQLSRDGQRLVVALAGRLYLVSRPDFHAVALATGPGPIDPQFSFDGRHVAYVRDNDVYAVDLVTNRERRITRGGTEDQPQGLAEFVAQEEMKRFSGFWWSPDGRSIAFQQTDAKPVERLSIQDPFHPERPAAVFRYPRAGQPNASVRLGLVPSSGRGSTVWVQWNAAKYPYLAAVTWAQGAPLTVLVQNRLQTEEVLLRVEPTTGQTTALLTERAEHWLDLAEGFPSWFDDGSGFLWWTQRNGGPEIEQRAAGGAPVKSWVGPGLLPDSLAGYDDDAKTLYFVGGPDPTSRQVYRVHAGGAPEPLGVGYPQPAQVRAELFAEGGALVTTSRALRRPQLASVYRTSDLQKLADLPSVAPAMPFASTTEIRAVGESPKLWTSITRPRSFRAGRSLPVIVQVYGGPTSQEVEQIEDPLRQWYADQGFIVVSIDNRGTPGRGVEFHRAVWRDFSQVTVADQVSGLHALAKEIPEIDLQRVGIQGWSFGGYLTALSVMERPDVFKAGAAGAPVVDWRDYDTHYTERYLGLPQDNAAGYDRSSLISWAPRLQRPLLIIHGTADDNVYFFHALKLSDALFRAGKPHRLLPLSNFTHMVPDPLVMERMHQAIADFFKQSL